MKEFSYFIVSKAVKKQTPDIHLAKATARDSLERLDMAKNILHTQKPKYILENAYEAVRELIDGILYQEGYKSYSHEASIAYLHTLGFSQTDIVTVDRLRKKRNGIKYYGENITPEEAVDALQIAERVIKELLKKKPALKPI